VETEMLQLALKYGASAVIAASVAWGAMRMKVANQTETISRLRVDRIAAERALDARVDGLAKDMTTHRQETTDRLARIETKLDLLLTNHFGASRNDKSN